MINTKKFLFIIILLVGLSFVLTACGGGDNKLSESELGAATPEEAISKAADAIEAGDIDEALRMFDPSSQNKMKDFLEGLDSEIRQEYAEELKNSTLEEEVDGLKTFSSITERVGGLPPVKNEFYVIKLPNGNWAIMN